MTPPVVVVGGSVAALVAADALAARGRDVELLAPVRGLGGGLAGIRRDGRVLELGMRVLELRHEAAPDVVPSLLGYAPGPAGHLPWLGAVRAFVEGLVGDRLVTLDAPRMSLGGRLHAESYLTLDPAGVVAGLSPAERAAVAGELADEVDGRGALGGPLDGVTLTAASRRNHGSLLHERLVAPVAAKLLDGGADRVLASLRRRVWQPLLWPSTVRDACLGRPLAFLPDRPLHGVRGAGCGEVLAALLRRIDESPRVSLRRVGALRTLTRVDGGALALTFDGGATVHARRPVLAAPPAELFAAAGAAYAPERARTVVAWVDAAEDDLLALPPVTTIVDPELAALRVTATGDAPAGRRLLCVELRWDLDPEDVDAAVRASLEGAGLLVKGGRLWSITQAVAPTYALPTAANAASFAAARARLAAVAPAAEVIGGAAHLAGDYVNEQVVAGLATAERLG